MGKAEVIVFNGVKFRRYPESKRRTDRVYFTPGIADKQRGVKRLHEEIWMAANGPIPEGHHIHHVDHDPLNNDISNLVALSESDHHTHHGTSEEAAARYGADEWKEHLDAIRPLAAAWHASPEGIEWHRRHATESYKKRPVLSGTCDQCGNAFLSKKPERFCSNKCKSAWRRASGLDDVTRTCVVCGSDFTINRYTKTKTCSRSCAQKLRRA